LKPILLDTGVIVACLDRREQFHARSAEIVLGLRAPLVTCEAVIAESCYLLRRLPAACEAVLDNVAAGIFQIPFRLSDSADRVRRILHQYRDRNIDLADASLIQLANELGTGDILTLDRDFHVYRWGANKAFHSLILDSQP
jgi:predicted nucleic acid-binding protein